MFELKQDSYDLDHIWANHNNIQHTFSLFYSCIMDTSTKKVEYYMYYLSLLFVIQTLYQVLWGDVQPHFLQKLVICICGIVQNWKIRKWSKYAHATCQVSKTRTNCWGGTMQYENLIPLGFELPNLFWPKLFYLGFCRSSNSP